MVEGKAVGEDEYDDLSEDVKNKIEKNSQMVQEKAGSIMRELRDMDKESSDRPISWIIKQECLPSGIM